MEELQIISILAALGVGSITTAAVQWCLNTYREQVVRAAAEKKEAFTGLLKSLERVNLHQRPEFMISGKESESLLEFAYWHLRCDLVASKRVREALLEFKETPPKEKQRRDTALANLISAMRADMGISR